ncbi:hypothetical protein V2H45_10355, partial [Tumidithrix elongata RA019]|nr:hypothetical protein [Tumidithrix elongata RA019]
YFISFAAFVNLPRLSNYHLPYLPHLNVCQCDTVCDRRRIVQPKNQMENRSSWSRSYVLDFDEIEAVKKITQLEF